MAFLQTIEFYQLVVSIFIPLLIFLLLFRHLNRRNK